MALVERLRAWSLILLGVCLVAGSADAAPAKKKKGPVTDPMEAETNPQGPTPTPGDTTNPPSGSDGTPGSGATAQTGPAANPHGGNVPTPAVQTEKVGRFMVNLKIGPALCAYASGPVSSGACNGFHQGAIVLDLGWSVLPSKNAYLLLPIQFQFRPSFGAIMVPVGFQYDLELPIKGLYVYPRAFFGYAALVSSGPNPLTGQTTSVTAHAGVFAPEFGIKYVFGGRWNVGGDLFSLPILFNADSAQVYYRILLYGGANF